MRLGDALEAVAQDPTDAAAREEALELATKLSIEPANLEEHLARIQERQRLRDALTASGTHAELVQQLREAGAELQECELAERARRQAFVVEHSRLNLAVDRARAAIERRTTTERELQGIERQIETFRDPMALAEHDRLTREARMREGRRIDLRRRRVELARELRGLNQGRFAPVDNTPQGVADARRHFEQQIAAIEAELAAEVTP